MVLRITTWNVNGIRNPFGYQPWRDRRTFDAMFDILEADIVIMQELKIQRKDLRDDMVLVPGWDCFFSLPKYKKGRWRYMSHCITVVLSGCILSLRGCVLKNVKVTRAWGSIQGRKNALLSAPKKAY